MTNMRTKCLANEQLEGLGVQPVTGIRRIACRATLVHIGPDVTREKERPKMKHFAGLCILALTGLALATPGMAQTAAPATVAAPDAKPSPVAAATPDKPEAEGSAFSADRPGFSEPADAVPRGVIQIESGVTFSVDTRPATVEYNLIEGSPLLRFGIGGRTELRFSGDGFRFSKDESPAGVERAHGISDCSIGAKIKVLKENGLLPAIAIQPELSLPIGHDQFSSSTLDPAIKLAWAKTLTHGFSAGGLLAFSWITGQERRVLQQGYSLSVAHSLPGGLGGYWEVYRISPTGAGSIWMFNTGITRMLRRNTQVDIEVGRTLKPTSPCWFVAGGVAVRLSPGLLRHAGN